MDNATLTERYRPRSLDDLYGQGHLVFHLREWLNAPHSNCFLFEGSTGTGKTSAAVALAHELGCDVDAGEWGGFYKIPSGEQTADRVRDLIQSTWTTPMGGSGWKVLLVEEADRLASNPTVENLWLSGLEDLAPRVVVIFTTNYVGKMPDRIVNRFDPYTFESSADILRQDAQTLVNAIWLKETGTMDDAPNVETIVGLVDRDGNLSLRRAVRALEPLLRRRRATLNGGTTPPPAVISLVAPASTAARNVMSGVSRPSPARPTATATAAKSADVRSDARPTADALRSRLRSLVDEFDRVGAEALEVDEELQSLDKQINRGQRNGESTTALESKRARLLIRQTVLDGQVLDLDDSVKVTRRELKERTSAAKV